MERRIVFLGWAMTPEGRFGIQRITKDPGKRTRSAWTGETFARERDAAEKVQRINCAIPQPGRGSQREVGK